MPDISTPHSLPPLECVGHLVTYNAPTGQPDRMLIMDTARAHEHARHRHGTVDKLVRLRDVQASQAQMLKLVGELEATITSMRLLIQARREEVGGAEVVR